jgi:hypothetical protein
MIVDAPCASAHLLHYAQLSSLQRNLSGNNMMTFTSWPLFGGLLRESALLVNQTPFFVATISLCQLDLKI